MTKQESFQTPLSNREKLIEEYRRLCRFRQEAKELPPAQQTRLLQRFAELQVIIGKDAEKNNRS